LLDISKIIDIQERRNLCMNSGCRL